MNGKVILILLSLWIVSCTPKDGESGSGTWKTQGQEAGTPAANIYEDSLSDTTQEQGSAISPADRTRTNEGSKTSGAAAEQP
jgi:hypothetical protein